MPYCSPNYTISYLDTTEFSTVSLHIIGCISIPIHIFGAYCILFKTPKSMCSVKYYMLNFHLWIFWVDLLITLLICPFLIFPVFAAGPYGILDKWLGVPRPIQTCLQFGSVEVMFTSIILIIENRYTVIADVNKYWTRVRKPWIVLNYLCSITIGIPIYLMIPEDQETSRMAVFEKLPCLKPLIPPADLFVVAEDASFLIYRGMIFDTLIVHQGCVFAWLTRVSLNRYKTRMSEKSLRLQRQFLRALAIQLIVPVLFLSFPLTYACLEYQFGFHYQKFLNIAMIVLASHGLPSSLVMLSVHSPYREFIIENFMAFLIRGRKEQLTNVVPSIVSTF